MMDYISIQIMYVIRMIIACLCGILIGFERKNRSKEAGIRTHCVVACASALMMIVSKYAFSDMLIGENGVRGADTARIAAQVVSGVGFLGAGMIFVHKNTITGLTTAAGIWATSGVGLAIGAGMYIVGISATSIIIMMQVFLHKNFQWLKMPRSKKLLIRGVDSEDFQECMTQKLQDVGINVYDVFFDKKESKVDYTFIIEIPINIFDDTILSLTERDCKLLENI
mgnify:FL=1